MPSPPIDPLFERLRQLRAAWVSRGWSWDRRFDCVASTLVLDDAERARRVVSSVLTERWTGATLPKAPPAIADVATSTGGVREDQVLYATPPAPLIAYGLWWPWGGEASNISVRIGLAGRVTNDDYNQLRDVFGIEDW